MRADRLISLLMLLQSRGKLPARQLAQELEALHITTVASSIENLATLQVLGSCGMKYVQGFFLQAPHTEMTYNFASGAS